MFLVELHCHLDGSVRPERLIAEADRLGRRAALKGFETVEALREKMILTAPAKDLSSFLDAFEIIKAVLRDDATAMENVAYDFYEDVVNHNIMYAEARYSPYTLAVGELNSGKVIEAVHRGFVQKQKEVNDPHPRCCQILCLLTINVGIDIINVGIDISGPAGPEFKFKDYHIAAYKRAKELGVNRTAHAGENSSAASVLQAIEELGCQRIGHGYHTFTDPEVVQLVKDKSVYLEMCPRSSWLTNSVKDLSAHPLKRCLDDDVLWQLVTINSDDPAIVGGFVDADVPWSVSNISGVTYEQLMPTVQNSLRAAFNPVFNQK